MSSQSNPEETSKNQQRRDQRATWNNPENRDIVRARIGAIIREIREQQEISIETIAEAVGFKTKAIIAIEQGRYMPSVEALDAIAHALGCKLDLTGLEGGLPGSQ